MSSSVPSSPDHPSRLTALLTALLTADGADSRIRRSARDWAIDPLCVLMAIGFGFLMLYFTSHAPEPHHYPPRVPDMTLGALTCLLLWVRRRYPVHVAVVASLAGLFSVTCSGAV